MGRAVDSGVSAELAYAMLQSAAKAIVLCDAAGQIVHFNPAARPFIDQLKSQDQTRPLLEASDLVVREKRTRLLEWSGASKTVVELFMAPLEFEGVEYWVVQLSDPSLRLASQRALQRQLQFERTVVSISESLMRVDRTELDACIESCLGDVGQFFGVDRAYIFRNSEDGLTMSNSHEWVAPGISREAANLQGVPSDTFPWLMREFLRDRSIHVPKVSELPAEAAAERAEFEREGIRSIVLVPMRLGAKLWGFAGFDAVRGEIDWTEDFELGLRLMAKMVVGSLQARELADRLSDLAFHDPLTGLANRKLLEDRLELAHARARRNGQAISLLLVDLDDFKNVNDRYGHAVGDLLLCEASARLLQVVRDADTVARLGGDEFVMLLDGAAQAEAEGVAWRALQAFAEPMQLPDLNLTVRLSIGVVTSRGGDLDPGELLRAADRAMYSAKARGKNQVRLHVSASETGDIDPAGRPLPVD